MFLTCLMISKDHVIKKLCGFMGGVSLDPAKFGGHKLWSSGDVNSGDIK